MPFITPFSDCVVPTAGTAERPNMGNSPDSPTAGKTGEAGFLTPKDLPSTSLFMGGVGANVSGK